MGHGDISVRGGHDGIGPCVGPRVCYLGHDAVWIEARTPVPPGTRGTLVAGRVQAVRTDGYLDYFQSTQLTNSEDWGYLQHPYYQPRFGVAMSLLQSGPILEIGGGATSLAHAYPHILPRYRGIDPRYTDSSGRFQAGTLRSAEPLPSEQLVMLGYDLPHDVEVVARLIHNRRAVLEYAADFETNAVAAEQILAATRPAVSFDLHLPNVRVPGWPAYPHRRFLLWEV